jgi:hypothetical protein
MLQQLAHSSMGETTEELTLFISTALGNGCS